MPGRIPQQQSGLEPLSPGERCRAVPYCHPPSFDLRPQRSTQPLQLPLGTGVSLEALRRDGTLKRLEAQFLTAPPPARH